jgi:hypothetical protein
METKSLTKTDVGLANLLSFILLVIMVAVSATTMLIVMVKQLPLWILLVSNTLLAYFITIIGVNAHFLF